MTPSYRVLTRLLTVIPAAGLFLLISANPFAQSNKLPAPASYISDFAGVIDSETKGRLENLLQKLKEKSTVELYVVVVDTTGAQEISDFSQQLARDWNIASKTTRSKTLLLVVSAASKTSFTQFSRTVRTSLPEGILGEMGYRMHGPLNDGRFAEALESGVRVFATALAEKIGFNVADLETSSSSSVAANSSEVPAESQAVLISTKTAKASRPRAVNQEPKPLAQGTPPVDQPRTEPTPSETPAAEAVSTETPKTDPTPTESPKAEATTESPKNTTSKTGRTKANAARTPITKTPVKQKTAAEIAEEELDEIDDGELTLTKPLPEHAVK